ncbi:MAG: Lrp/AsnC family transcriptional regulator [Nitrososphaerota archaeon]|nr:Lrp/AsnC family transcriptional regulator [Nitrososphaerota archaeon]MDG6919503.1 Lrp/AsnC family transcriptional regulator [Nitrososphaerota archaeon]MDG6946731.1 Lrp/AsnC family transcriptional regulator [Nitrososphaerota archaeon]
MLYKDIAQKAGVSLPTVRTRIQKLLELGVIKKFTVIVDADEILGKVRGLVLLQVNPSDVDKVMARLVSMKEVREVYRTAGSNPLVLKVEASDLDGLGQLISERLSGIEGITGASSLVVTKTGKEEYGASVQAEAMVHFKCSFCSAPILGKPYVEYIDGGRYYFNAEESANAYKQRKLRKEAS